VKASRQPGGVDPAARPVAPGVWFKNTGGAGKIPGNWYILGFPTDTFRKP